MYVFTEDKFPEKCKKCKHRNYNYCRAYQVEISIINVENCRRKKELKLLRKIVKRM